MSVKKIPFWVSISIRLKFATAEALSNREDVMIISSININKAIYDNWVFILNYISSDNEFESIW